MKYLNFTAVFPLLTPQLAMIAESLISTSNDSWGRIIGHGILDLLCQFVGTESTSGDRSLVFWESGLK